MSFKIPLEPKGKISFENEYFIELGDRVWASTTLAINTNDPPIFYTNFIEGYSSLRILNSPFSYQFSKDGI